MKKLNVKTLIAVVVVIVFVGLLCAFLKGGGENKEIATGTTYKTEIEKKINEEIERIEAGNPDGWRNAYIDFLSRYRGEYSEFNEERIFLGYVDDNDVPELFISEGSSHACSAEIYTFENNIVTLLCKTGENGMAYYFERQGIVCGYYAGMGAGTYWIYTVDNASVSELYNAFTNEGWGGEEFEVERRINGIDVTADELDEFLDSYFWNEAVTVVFDDANPGYELKSEACKDYINSFGK